MTEEMIGNDGLPPAGRTCPLHYRYAASDFARAADYECDVLYVVGGLYGNLPALDQVLAMFDREVGRKRLVFNGDFNWFNIEPGLFERLNQRVLQFDALRGNVETELGSAVDAGDDTGCGCAYPEWVSDQVVDRSNRIMQRLRATASAFPLLREQLGKLPMNRRVDIGDLRIAIVHGDAESLAGWGFAQEHLQDRQHLERVRGWFDAARVDAFACSHTCLPVLLSLSASGRKHAPIVINNGAAGMPNFRDDRRGLMTRIATTPFQGPLRRYGVLRGGVHFEAIAIPFDQATWAQEFVSQWPDGSDAHASYWDRIINGPSYDEAAAVRCPELDTQW